MIELVERHRAEVEELCRRHHVRRLELFGSAAEGTWDASRSDLDFLVEFQPLEPSQAARALFGLQFGLEDLFGREIDLVMPEGIKNPYFLRSVNRSRKVLYAS